MRLNFLPLYQPRGDIDVLDLGSIYSEQMVAETTTTSCKQQQQQCSQSRKRKVRFDTKNNQSYENLQLCHEDCAQLWFTSVEQQQFRDSAKRTIESVRLPASHINGDNGLGSLVEKLYQACTQAVEGSVSTNVWTRLEERALANAFASDTGLSRVGMERRACRTMSKDKRWRRRTLVDIVQELREMSCVGEKLCCVHQDDRVEEMRQELEAVSLPSRLFAYYLAQAQAAAARVEA